MTHSNIDRRTALGLGLATSAAALLPAAAHAAADEARVASIHKSVIVIDPHADVPDDFGTGTHDAGIDGDTQVDLPKLERGQVDGVGLATFVPQGKRDAAATEAAWARAKTKLAAIREVPARYPAKASLVATAEDIRHAHRDGKVAILPTVLNGYPIGKDLSRIDWLYSQGVRVFGFVHAGHNDLADSSRPALDGPATEHGGLSPLGRRAVGQLNDLGVLIDVSQLSNPAFEQTLVATRAPVVASHSGVRALVEATRNLSDAELDLLKANGGVVHIVAFNGYLSPKPADLAVREEAIRAKWGLKPGQSDRSVLSDQQVTQLHREINTLIPKVGVSALVDQVEYVVRRIGIGHVGIASDFNHGGGVAGWGNEGEALGVTRELVRRGHDEAAIAKIWGGNFLRVLAAADTAKRA